MAERRIHIMRTVFSQRSVKLAQLAAMGITLGLAAPAMADELTAEQIVEKTYCASFYQGDDSSAEMSMVITDAQGRKQDRELIMLRRDEPGDKCADQQVYAYFKRPADVQKMRFMAWKEKGKDDSRWLYLPAIDLVKRISAADKRTSFAGTHYFYEDVSGRSITADTHKLASTTDNYYIIESTPKNEKEVEFKYYKMFIHKTSFVTIKAEFYDRSGKVYRTFEAKKVETIDGFPTVTHAVVTDTKIGGSTEAKASKVKYNRGIPKNIFTERYLRQVPTDYVK
jgi:Outer membrane lipoprotein-sorting protein